MSAFTKQMTPKNPAGAKTLVLLDLLPRLWRHLSKLRRRQLIALFGAIVLSAFAEVVSLGAVFPFLGVLISPDKVFEQPMVSGVAHFFGITSAGSLALFLTIVFVTTTLLAGAIRLLALWASTRLSFAIGVDLSIDMYRRTLYQPYSVHVARNSSEVIIGITTKTSAIVLGVLLPLLQLATSLIVLVAIASTLIAVDPVIAVFSAVGFGLSYALITMISGNQLRRNSICIAEEQTQLFKTLQEGLGGIRDVLLDGTQPLYCDIYHRADSALRKAQGGNTFISASPRFAMEALGMTLIAILGYSVSTQSGGLTVALPVLGMLALGAQRLIPALQQGYASWTSVVGNGASLADTLELLDQPLPPESLLPAPDPLPFNDSIRFSSVSFRYVSDGPWVLDRLELHIRKGARVGFVGITGSGKSTAIDLLMGLLEPSSGRILVDDQVLTGSKLRAWQRNIAHVPQHVYLADATIAENIAFGIRTADIDLERVKEAARKAQIAEFIENNPKGYFATVGERGVRLSGGQRQRIGIARALYKRATVLVFDEATSALDNVTEQAVMDAIENLGRDLTILLVAHRLTTIQRCDRVIELSQGRLVAEGSFKQLLSDSPTFRALASASS
jgi:ATP-binding cassette, subfamily B, bacterial PglK